MKMLSVVYLFADCFSLIIFGAGSGNRTRTLSLEGSYDTISPYPHFDCCVIRAKFSVKHITTVAINFQVSELATGASVDFISLETLTKSRLICLGVVMSLAAPMPFSPSHRAQSLCSMNKGIR